LLPLLIEEDKKELAQRKRSGESLVFPAIDKQFAIFSVTLHYLPVRE
jgi:hypothetical protein